MPDSLILIDPIMSARRLRRRGMTGAPRGIGRLFRETWALIALTHDMEVLMRILALAILTIAAILTAQWASAQTYSPDYPVCLRWAKSYDCSYTSLAQCNASASGRTAECYINPYFASAREPAGYRRHRRAY
jgi:hypothetical protein